MKFGRSGRLFCRVQAENSENRHFIAAIPWYAAVEGMQIDILKEDRDLSPQERSNTAVIG